jgi:hypothetical protein
VPVFLLLLLKGVQPVHVYLYSTARPPGARSVDWETAPERGEAETKALRALLSALKHDRWAWNFRVHYAVGDRNDMVLAYSRLSRILSPDYPNRGVQGEPNCVYEFHYSGIREADNERPVAKDLDFRTGEIERFGWTLHEEHRGEGGR